MAKNGASSTNKNGRGAGRKTKGAAAESSTGEKERRPDRAATERALMDAARRILERDGVLAGLNMQEVADEAGVNRGLIHHYFGSRQSLLRAALETGQSDAAPRVLDMMHHDVDDRGTWSFRQYRRDNSFARMVMLLALDGDEQFEPMAMVAERLEAFAAEQAKGEWDEDADLLALLVAWDVMLNGYFVLRSAIARQLGMTENQLDRRVLPVLGGFFKQPARSASS